MTMKVGISFFVALGSLIVLLSACKTTSEGLPDEISLPAGVEVVAMELMEAEAGELPGSGTKGFTVTVELNQAVPSGEFAIIAYVVRDSEVIRGEPIAAGFVGMTSSDGTTASRSNNFNLTCVDGDVAGRAISGAFGMDGFDRSTGERNTRIFVQHAEGIRTFLGATVGVKGVKSNRIRVSCPQ